MDLTLWVASAALGLLNLLAGAIKLASPSGALVRRLPWTSDFSPAAIRLIGSTEALGGIGLILPWAFDIAPVLTPMAALGLAAFQTGAAVVHLRRQERRVIVINALLVVSAAFIAAGRAAQLLAA